MACSDQPALYILIGAIFATTGYVIGGVVLLLYYERRLLVQYSKRRYPRPNSDSSERSDQASMKENAGSAASINKIFTTTTQFGHAKSDMDRNIGYSAYV